MYDLYSTILLFNFFLSLFLSAALSFKKETTLPNIILGFALFLLSSTVLKAYFQVTENMEISEILNILAIPSAFCIIPLLYIYSFILTQHKTVKSKYQLLHLIPFLLIMLWNIFHMILTGKNMEITLTILIFFLIQTYYYLFAILDILRKYHRKIRIYFSEIKELQLSWLKTIIIFITLIWSISIYCNFLTYFEIDFPFYVININLITGTFFLFTVAFFTLRRPELFHRILNLENLSKEEKSYPDMDDMFLLEKLKMLMENEKLFKNNTLSLKELSDIIKIQPYRLTQVIAKTEKHNFYSFINNYRVDEVKNLLSDPKNKDRTVLELAFQAGFNSKTTFNEFFKKSEKTTPTDFRKKVLKRQ